MALGRPRPLALTAVVRGNLPVAVRVVDPEHAGDCVTFFTEGLSDVYLPNTRHPMAAQFAELHLSVPGDWPLDKVAGAKAEGRAFWPVGLLRRIADRAARGRTPVGHGVLLDPGVALGYGGTLGPGTAMTHVLLVEDGLVDRLALADGRTIVPLRALLLHPSEAALVGRTDDPEADDPWVGHAELLRRFGERAPDFYFSIDRPPVA